MQSAVEGESQDPAFLRQVLLGAGFVAAFHAQLSLPRLDSDSCPCGDSGTTTGYDYGKLPPKIKISLITPFKKLSKIPPLTPKFF